MGTTKRRQFDRDFKLRVLAEIEAGKPVAQAAREHHVHPNTISAWRELHRQYGNEAFAGNGNTYTHEAKIAELERLIGQQTIEIALLKKGLSLNTAHTHQKDGSR